MLMKRGLILGLFLLVFVLVGSFGILSAQNPEPDNFVTETITCKFIDPQTGKSLTEERECFNTFSYGNIEIPTGEFPREDGQGTYTTQLQYYCQGVGECSITIRGERGAKMKWSSDCFVDLTNKSYGEYLSNPNLTTVIDGTEKSIEFECNTKSFMERLLLKLMYAWYKVFGYVSNPGHRSGYVLCFDGTEIVMENNAPFCKTSEEIFNTLKQKCENKCDISGFSCGFAVAISYDSCDLDNPERDVKVEVLSTINP